MAPPDSNDAVTAQKLAQKLLCPAVICDVGWFGGYPTLRFANETIPNEIWLSMGGGFALAPSADLPSVLTFRQRSLLS